LVFWAPVILSVLVCLDGLDITWSFLFPVRLYVTTVAFLGLELFNLRSQW